MKFIIQTFLVSLIFFTIYTSCLLVFPKIQNKVTVQNFWQGNKIKAEHFFSQKKAYDIIIVGTSMSEGLNLDQFGEKAFTLNFIGGSSLTGLELIKRSLRFPKILIIETNWLERPVNDDIVAKVSNPNLALLKSLVPSLSESNQPVNVLAAVLNFQPSLIDTLKEKKHFLSILSQNIKAGNVEIDTANVKKNVKTVGALISYFKENGVQVYLMNLPMDKKLYNTNRFSVTRLAIHKYLSHIDSIPRFDSGTFETSDGYHFLASSKKTYINYLTQFLTKSNDWHHHNK